jgi:hypothetical protein
MLHEMSGGSMKLQSWHEVSEGGVWENNTVCTKGQKKREKNTLKALGHHDSFVVPEASAVTLRLHSLNLRISICQGALSGDTGAELQEEGLVQEGLENHSTYRVCPPKRYGSSL